MVEQASRLLSETGKRDARSTQNFQCLETGLYRCFEENFFTSKIGLNDFARSGQTPSVLLRTDSRCPHNSQNPLRDQSVQTISDSHTIAQKNDIPEKLVVVFFRDRRYTGASSHNSNTPPSSAGLHISLCDISVSQDQKRQHGIPLSPHSKRFIARLSSFCIRRRPRRRREAPADPTVCGGRS